MKSTILILLLVPTIAFGWGEEGHRITGAIAEQYITKTNRSKLNKILGKYSIEDLSNWLDWKRADWKSASSFHYLSMPVGATKYEDEHCNSKGICAVSMIRKYKAIALDKYESPEAKAEAIKVIIHLFEDVHMPLHTGGKKGDKGGNGVDVRFFTRNSNLHKVFDTELIKYSGKSEEQWVYELTKDLTDEKVKSIQEGSLIDWIEDSHKHVAPIYSNLPKVKDGKVQMTEEYVKFGNEVISEQMLEAGVRLGKFLNDLVGKMVVY